MSIIVHREKNPVFITHNIDLNYVKETFNEWKKERNDPAIMSCWPSG